MNHERWQRIEDVFHRVLEAEDGEQERLLAEACAGDAELRREVAALLAGASNAGASIRGVLAAEAGRVATDARAMTLGRRLGPYRIRALIGEGGMGAVYLAERDDAQFAKQVAIKILPHAIGSPQAVARFRDERQILAALEHRNIVRLLDGGSTDTENHSVRTNSDISESSFLHHNSFCKPVKELSAVIAPNALDQANGHSAASRTETSAPSFPTAGAPSTTADADVSPAAAAVSPAAANLPPR